MNPAGKNDQLFVLSQPFCITNFDGIYHIPLTVMLWGKAIAVPLSKYWKKMLKEIENTVFYSRNAIHFKCRKKQIITFPVFFLFIASFEAWSNLCRLLCPSILLFMRRIQLLSRCAPIPSMDYLFIHIFYLSCKKTWTYWWVR